MDAALYDSLSPRELACLQLVAQGLNSKEIAARLTTSSPDGNGRTISGNTVDGYIKTAMAKLGVNGRKDAARLVAEHEGSSPRWLGDQSPGVDPAPLPPPAPPQAPSPGRTSFPWPWRRHNEVSNDLSIATRLLWIPLIAIGLAAGFGMLSSGLKVVADLVGSTRLLTHAKEEARDGPDCNRQRRRQERDGLARACA